MVIKNLWTILDRITSDRETIERDLTQCTTHDTGHDILNSINDLKREYSRQLVKNRDLWAKREDLFRQRAHEKYAAWGQNLNEKDFHHLIADSIMLHKDLAHQEEETLKMYQDNRQSWMISQKSGPIAKNKPRSHHQMQPNRSQLEHGTFKAYKNDFKT